MCAEVELLPSQPCAVLRGILGATDEFGIGLMEVKVILGSRGGGRPVAGGLGELRLKDETDAVDGPELEVEPGAVQVVVVAGAAREVVGVGPLETATKFYAGLEPGGEERFCLFACGRKCNKAQQEKIQAIQLNIL